MKKGNTLLIVGAAAVALFLFKDKLFGAGGGSTSKLIDQNELPPADETTPAATETTTADAIVDASKPGSSIESALNTAKTLAQSAKDIAVLIKTPSGQKNVLLTKGKKKAKRKKCKLTRKQILANCQGLKGKQKRQCVRKTRKSCTTITIEPTQSMTFSK